MEYAAGGELYDFLSLQRGVSDNEARSFFRQIVSAVSYCHQVSENYVLHYSKNHVFIVIEIVLKLEVLNRIKNSFIHFLNSSLAC